MAENRITWREPDACDVCGHVETGRKITGPGTRRAYDGSPTHDFLSTWPGQRVRGCRWCGARLRWIS